MLFRSTDILGEGGVDSGPNFLGGKFEHRRNAVTLMGHFSRHTCCVTLERMALLVRTCFLMIVAASQSLLSAFGAGQAPAGRFDGEIAALLAADRTNPPPANSVVFAGSSTFRLWKTLGTDLAGFPVVNRGFGGSTMSDLNQYAAQIVIPLRPKTVVIYEGDNDIAAGTSPETILKEFETFAQTVEKTLPQVKIVIVSVKDRKSVV